MAGFSNTIEDDLLMIAADDPRSVTFYRRSDTSGDPPSSGGVALSGIHRVHTASGMSTTAGAVIPYDGARFHVQAKQLSYSEPHPGDVVADDDGTRYSVDSVEVSDNGTRYVLTCTKEVG